MSFEVVEPGHFVYADALKEGQCAIARDGTLSARAADLERVGIKVTAVILACKSTLRIGLRSGRKGEEALHVKVCPVLRGKRRLLSGRVRVNLRRALGVLCLEPQAVAGRYDTMLPAETGGPNDVIIVCLLPDTKGAVKAKK